MKIAYVYSEVAYGRHRPGFNFSDLEGHKSGLTGTDAIALNYPRELAARGHEVTLYCHGVGESTSYDGVEVLDFKHWGDEGKGVGMQGDWDAIIAVSNPNCLRYANPRALKCVNRQVARFGIDSFEYETAGYDAFVDVYLCPSEYSVRLVSAGLPHPEKFRVLPDGCYPEMFEPVALVEKGVAGFKSWNADGLKKPGQVAYVSSPDRGLHLLLSIWPEVRRRVPHAELVIAYQSLDAWIAFHCDPAKRMGGPVDEECTRRALYVRNALRKLEGHGVKRVGGGMSHRDVVRLLSESEVLAYPCDPLAPTETFSVAVLEACAAGCATIISSADCLEEVHGHATAVVRAPVGERLGEFADLVVRGLTEPGFRREFAELGRAHAKAHDWRLLAEKLEKMLEEGIAAKRAPKFIWQDSSGFGVAVPQSALELASRVESLEKPRIDLVLTPYASGAEPIDIDHPFDSNSGGGCRAGFMGLVQELPKHGYDVRAFSTFKGDLPRHNRKSEPSYHPVSDFKQDDKRDVLLAYYDTSPLVGVSGCLRVASHHTFAIPAPGAFEWTDVNLAPSQYAVDALRKVFDAGGGWGVMPNAVQPDLPEWRPVPGRCVYHTSPSRGLWRLFEMWPEIRKRVPHATLHVVGDLHGWFAAYEDVRNRQGDVARRTIAALSKMKIKPEGGNAEGVTFLGRLSRAEMLRELSEASCFPFPFESVGPTETFSVSILECLAIGVPVIYSPGDALTSLYYEHAIEAQDDERFVSGVGAILTADRSLPGGEDSTKAWARAYTFENKARALDEVVRRHLSGSPGWAMRPMVPQRGASLSNPRAPRGTEQARAQPGLRPAQVGK